MKRFNLLTPAGMTGNGKPEFTLERLQCREMLQHNKRDTFQRLLFLCVRGGERLGFDGAPIEPVTLFLVARARAFPDLLPGPGRRDFLLRPALHQQQLA